jgi:hypothetical protein
VADWLKRYEETYFGPLPVRLLDDVVSLDVGILPEGMRNLAEVFSEELTPHFAETLRGYKATLLDMIKLAPSLVADRNGRGVLEPKDFPPALRPNLQLLVQEDSEVMKVVEQARRKHAQAAARASQLASQAVPAVAQPAPQQVAASMGTTPPSVGPGNNVAGWAHHQRGRGNGM